MIDITKIKLGDKLYTFKYIDVYSVDDEYGSISLPIGVKEFFVKDIVLGCVINYATSITGNSVTERGLFYTEEEAVSSFKKRLLELWKDYECEKIIKKLLDVKKIVNKLKEV